MSRLSERGYVARQYGDASRLDARVRIYELFATNPEPLTHWLFERMRLASGERVLDLGCGPGNLWRDNARRLPAGLRLMLADRSRGMLEAARTRVAGLEARIERTCCDLQELPFADASFDVVLASHVMYHVPDRSRAIAEARRVLCAGGRLFVATNDWMHLIEIRELAQRFGFDSGFLPVGRDPEFFDLENAVEEIGAVFSNTRSSRRRDELRITDPRVLVDYMRSIVSDDPANEPRLIELARHAARQIERAGALDVSACAGLVEARKVE